MKKTIALLLVATTGLVSCGQGVTPSPDSVHIDSSSLAEAVKPQQVEAGYNEKYIDTKYEYRDSSGRSLTIRNSLPKGGLRYTGRDGKVYVYAVFFTEVINETATPFEFAIDFPASFHELPSAPGRSFKLLFPPLAMSVLKENAFDYGLAGLKPFLDTSIDKSSSLKRTIKPQESTSFYVVTLFYPRGLDGALRTGLSLKGQDVFYKVHDKEIPCGRVNLATLTLQD